MHLTNSKVAVKAQVKDYNSDLDFMKEQPSNNAQAPRRRSITSLTLTWLAERMRKAEKVKSAIEQGNYKVNSEELAKSIVVKVP